MSIVLPSLPGLGDALTPAVAPNAALTPQGIQAQRDYAKALLSTNRDKGGAQFPVVQSWTQGVSNMVNALMGGGELYNANQRELEGQNRLASSTDTTPKAKSFDEGSSSEGHEKTADASDSTSTDVSQPRGYRNNNPLNIESGSFTQGQPGYSGSDGRFAKFASMDQGVGAANALLDNYSKKGLNTVTGIINRWAPSTDGNDVNAYALDVAKKMGVDPNQALQPEQRQQLIAAMAQHENGKPMPGGGGQAPTAMAFAGPDSGQDGNPAVQAMATALKGGQGGGQQVAENTQLAAARGTPPAPGAAAPHPMPNGSGMYVDPRLVQKRPQYSEGQIRDIMSNPTLDIQTKLGFLQQYQQQGQPISMPYPGGTVIIDPNNPSRQQFIPELQKGTKKMGDLETPSYGTVTPGQGGGVQFNPAQQPPAPAVGPQSSAAPAVAPGGGPAVPPGAVQATAQNAPPPPAAPPSPPVQVASNDPTAGFAAAAAAQGQKPPIPGIVPTGALPEGATPPGVIPAAAVANNPLAKFAQSGPPPGVSPDALRLNNFAPQDVQDYTNKKAYDQARELAQKKGEADIGVTAEAQKDSNKLSAKRYEDMMASTGAAGDQLNNIATATALTKDPNFYAGFGSDAVGAWKRFKAALGVDPDASAPMEVFKKTTAQSIMTGLKTAFQGLGQIRVAEIRLQELANASTSNTPTAIKALLEITGRNAAKTAKIGEMASAYKTGDAVVDPDDPKKVLIPANTPGPDGEPMERTGLDAHWDRMLHQYYKDHPTFTKDEYDHFTEALKGGKGEAELPSAPGKTQEQAPKEGAPPGVGDTKEFATPDGGKVTGVWDGTKWGPKK